MTVLADLVVVMIQTWKKLAVVDAGMLWKKTVNKVATIAGAVVLVVAVGVAEDTEAEVTMTVVVEVTDGVSPEMMKMWTGRSHSPEVKK